MKWLDRIDTALGIATMVAFSLVALWLLCALAAAES
jgi:hypothetical protein